MACTDNNFTLINELAKKEIIKVIQQIIKQTKRQKGNPLKNLCTMVFVCFWLREIYWIV